MQIDGLGRIYIARPARSRILPGQVVLVLTSNYSVMGKLPTAERVQQGVVKVNRLHRHRLRHHPLCRTL